MGISVTGRRPGTGRPADGPVDGFDHDPEVRNEASLHDDAAKTARRRPAVLMLGGFGRSGSTLLERCLAECTGAVGVGEVLHLWERGLRDDELCGCGVRFSACPFWQRVGAAAYGGWDRVNTAEAVDDRVAVVRNRYLPELACKLPLPRRRVTRRRLLDRLELLYQAISEVSEGDLIIDSSKHPAYAYLMRAAEIRLKCVLVVRDPRGVAYSWAKVVKRPETAGGEALMPRYSTSAAVARWALYGILFHALSLLRVPVLVVHYEDFMARPVETVERVLRFAGAQSVTATQHVRPGEVTLAAHHTVAGNPMRFKTGVLPIRQDSAWRQQMPSRDRRIASVLSAPLRAAYAAARNLTAVKYRVHGH